MANSILETILSQFDGDALSKLSQRAGVDEGQAETGLKAAVPVLLGAMERNAAQGEGAKSLEGALERDHDGSILDNIGGFLNSPERANGAGILGHVLGGKREAVEAKMAEQTGIGGGALSQILEMAAPLVMGALGRRKSADGLGLDQLSGFLGQQREESEQQGGIMGLAVSLLDADKDGDVMDDLAGMAGKLFGGR